MKTNFELLKNAAVLLLVLLCNMDLRAQKQLNVWYFGDGAGLDFNDSCKPRVLTNGAMIGFEGCATMADKTTGELLFYTNSEAVWNKNHVMMPNGNLIAGGSTITQVLIIEKPGSGSQYYVVTSEIMTYSGQHYRFHLIDMNLNGGLGGFVYKDSILFNDQVTEKITAVRHANGSDIWLVGHEYGTNHFLSFRVDSTGIDINPIISAVGNAHVSNSYYDAIGELKASPGGTKIAAVTLEHPDIQLFNFNNVNGQISNPITLLETGGYDTIGNASGIYGLSFSPDNTKLYVTGMLHPSKNIPGKIMQFDITSNDSATINNSKTTIYSDMTKSFYSLKIGPDRKIYVGQNQTSEYIGVINIPDNPGVSCNYVDSAIHLNGKHAGWGLNNLMEYNIYCEPISEEPTGVSTIASGTPSDYFYPNPFSSEIIFYTNKLGEITGMEIYDVVGHKLRSIQSVNSEKIVIQRGQLSDGLYYVRIRYQDKSTVTHKISLVK